MLRRLLKGQSLLGFMLALSLSAFLLLVISHFTSRLLGQHTQLSQRLILQQELQRALRLIGKDLQRSGFRALPKNAKESNLPLFNLDEQQHYVLLEDNCILFFYDRQQDGCVGEASATGCVSGKRNVARNTGADLHGYRLHKQMLQIKTSGKESIDDCTKTSCQRFLDPQICTGTGYWYSLFDETQISVTDFSAKFLANKRAVQLYLKGQLQSQIYETQIVVPLFNLWEHSP